MTHVHERDKLSVIGIFTATFSRQKITQVKENDLGTKYSMFTLTVY